MESKAEWLLIDDQQARQVAERLFREQSRLTKVKGTLGVIVTAFSDGIVTLAEAVTLIGRIENRPDIWIHSSLCQSVVKTLSSTDPDGTGTMSPAGKDASGPSKDALRAGNTEKTNPP